MQNDMAELSEWPTIKEAAAALQTSPRSIERRISAGEIETKKRSRPLRKPETVCNPADVQRLKPPAHVMPAEQARLNTRPAEQSDAGELVRTGPGTQERNPALSALDLLVGLGATMAAKNESRASHKRWLTVAEASDSSGLSERFLRGLIRSNGIAAVKDGRTWKIGRDALEEWKPSQ